MRRNNKALYEQIMRNVSREVKRSLNESVEDSLNKAFYALLFGKLNYMTKSIDEILQDERILKKIAGYIVEEQVKDLVQYMFTENYQDENGYHAGTRIMQDENGLPRYTDGGDNWWDFMLDGQKVEIKAFQKGTLYSNVKATANQLKYKNDLTFMLVEYKVVNGNIQITGVALVDGSDIDFDPKYDRLVKNPNIKFKTGKNFSSKYEDYADFFEDR